MAFASVGSVSEGCKRMAYSARVVEVMIASPGDVVAERQAVREVLSAWNVVNARGRKAMLIPIGWETDSTPELGGRAQQMINDRLLAHCDLLVGIFWTRLGSPTGVAASGTVEEIEEHTKAGKPAMLYFSKVPTAPGYDAEQYAKLMEFKAWATPKGLVATFASADEFRENFRRDLGLIIRDNSHLANELALRDAGEGDALRALSVALSDAQSELKSLRDKIGPRILLEGPFVAALRGKPQPKHVEILYTGGNPECHGLAEQIRMALEFGAEWDTPTVSAAPLGSWLGGQVSGVSVVANPSDVMLGGALRDGLSPSLNEIHPLVEMDQLAVGTIRIVVAPKPP